MEVLSADVVVPVRMEGRRWSPRPRAPSLNGSCASMEASYTTPHAGVAGEVPTARKLTVWWEGAVIPVYYRIGAGRVARAPDHHTTCLTEQPTQRPTPAASGFVQQPPCKAAVRPALFLIALDLLDLGSANGERRSMPTRREGLGGMTTQTLWEWGEVKPLNEFPVSRASTDDRSGWCRACHAVASREYRQTPPRPPERRPSRDRDPLLSASDRGPVTGARGG